MTPTLTHVTLQLIRDNIKNRNISAIREVMMMMEGVRIEPTIRLAVIISMMAPDHLMLRITGNQQ